MKGPLMARAPYDEHGRLRSVPPCDLYLTLKCYTGHLACKSSLTPSQISPRFANPNRLCLYGYAGGFLAIPTPLRTFNGSLEHAGGLLRLSLTDWHYPT